MAGGLVLKWGAIAAGILLVVVIIVACIAYFIGKNSAKKMQGGMNQHRIRAFDAHLPQQKQLDFMVICRQEKAGNHHQHKLDEQAGNRRGDTGSGAHGFSGNTGDMSLNAYATKSILGEAL